jgi:hypothetical protein
LRKTTRARGSSPVASFAVVVQRGDYGPTSASCLRFSLAITALNLPAAHARQSEDFARVVDVGGGRQIYLECRGIGSPTVILVAGLRASAEVWNMAERPGPRVFPEVATLSIQVAWRAK